MVLGFNAFPVFGFCVGRASLATSSWGASARTAPVAAAILAAVSPGFQPGGLGCGNEDMTRVRFCGPGGKMPPDTAGKRCLPLQIGGNARKHLLKRRLSG
jgi:hypothetical protein